MSSQLTSEGGLPRRHGVERAAARIHQIADVTRKWHQIDDSKKLQYRAAVAHVLRDLAPEPAKLNTVPLLWWSPKWGVLQAERFTWSQTQKVTPIGFDRDLLMDLPEDAVPMTPIQPSEPGESLDDIRSAA